MKSTEYYTATQPNGFIMVVACIGKYDINLDEVRCEAKYLIYTENGYDDLIFKPNKQNGTCLKYSHTNDMENFNRTFSPSTYTEIAWLEACKKANKSILYKDFIQMRKKTTYEIY